MGFFFRGSHLKHDLPTPSPLSPILSVMNTLANHLDTLCIRWPKGGPQELVLSSTTLAGPIPAQLFLLTNLQCLYLSDNELSGELSPEVGRLTNLHVLYLFGNDLSGVIPRQIGTLWRLREI